MTQFLSYEDDYLRIKQQKQKHYNKLNIFCVDTQ